MEQSEEDSSYGAFIEKFILSDQLFPAQSAIHTACHPPPAPQSLTLQGLTFAVKSIFDVEGYVTSFGNPDWAATHPPAKSTASAVQALLKAGATCLGITVMDEMAYSVNGENIHYWTPRNPCAIGHVPGGSSSGSAVAVAANIVDFSLGTDTGGSVRVPASYCGIFGFRSSHGIVSVKGVTPFAQSFDTVGWFARDPAILNRVGDVLLPCLPDDDESTVMKPPVHVLIADDCFQLSTIPVHRVMGVVIESITKLFGGNIIKHLMLGEYVKDNIPSLSHFIRSEADGNDMTNIPLSMIALANVNHKMQRYEFRNNHEKWVTTVKPNLDPRIAERVSVSLKTTDEGLDLCKAVKTELHDALTSLIGDYGVLAIPTVVDPPPKLKMDVATMARKRAYGPLSIAGLSGFCQVSIPLGMYDGLPVSISLVAKHGSDKFLLNFTRNIYCTLREQSDLAEKLQFHQEYIRQTSNLTLVDAR